MAGHEIRDMTRLNLDRWNRLGDDAGNALEFLDDEFEIDGTQYGEISREMLEMQSGRELGVNK